MDGIGETAMEASGLCYRYGKIQALTGGSVTLKWGQITCLVGGNASGKSTLVQCLSGILTPGSGTIIVDGTIYRSLSVRLARKLGIAVVHQEIVLADGLDVTSNVFLGREPTRFGFLIDRQRMERDCQDLLSQFKITLPATGVTVGTLSAGQKQAVAVMQAIAQGGRILVLDEPLASLGVREGLRLLGLIQQMKTNGKAILCVTTNRELVQSLADSIAVMKDGRTLCQVPAATCSANLLTLWMSGVEEASS